MRIARRVFIFLVVLGFLVGPTPFVVGEPVAAAPGSTSQPSPTPHLDQVVAELRRTSPAAEGTVWRDTAGNLLPGSPDQWFLDTPGCFGSVDCAEPLGTEEFLNAITEVVASARQSVDITTLWPFPDGAFQQAIVAGLDRGLAAGHRPTVRVLAGSPVVYSLTGTGPQRWRSDIQAALGARGARLKVAVAIQSTNLLSWNHSKMVVADGRSAIVGGQNLWADSYLNDTPVADLSMRLEGPAARAVADFAGLLWNDTCSRRDGWLGWLAVRYSAANLWLCPSRVALPAPTTPGDTRILTVGRLGIGVPVPGVAPTWQERLAALAPCPVVNHLDGSYGFDARNPGPVALRALIASAREEVFISQQDLIGICPKIDERLFRVLAERLVADVDVTIVLSGGFGTSYSNADSLQDVSERIYDALLPLVGDPEATEQRICNGLRLASIRNGPNATWPGGSKIANHSKFVSVDDAAFAVGSGNLYPATLQEMDVIVEDRAAAEAVRADYLDPLWTWSRASAVIDADQGRCDIFN